MLRLCTGLHWPRKPTAAALNRENERHSPRGGGRHDCLQSFLNRTSLRTSCTIRTLSEHLHRPREPTAAALTAQGKDSFAYCKGPTTTKGKDPRTAKEKEPGVRQLLEKSSSPEARSAFPSASLNSRYEITMVGKLALLTGFLNPIVFS